MSGVLERNRLDGFSSSEVTREQDGLDARVHISLICQ